MSLKRKYIEEIDLVRGLAILGVLFVHATSFPMVELAEHSRAYPLYLILNKFGKLGTPTFIFLSSLVLFYTYYHRTLNRERLQHFYSQRLSFIIVPYLLWSVAFYMLRLTGGFENMDGVQNFDWSRFLGHDLLWGKAHAHLYFVIISIQFYIIFPLLLLLLQKQKGLVKWIFLIGFLGQWGFFFYNNLAEVKVTYKGSIALSYLSYYTLGAFVGVYYESVTAWLKKKAKLMVPIVTLAWLASGAFHAYIHYPAYKYGDWFNSRWYEFGWNMYTLISVLMLYYVALWFIHKAPRLWRSVLAKLGLVSFGIYLIHPMVLYFWRKYVEASEIPIVFHLQILGAWSAALFVSWLIVYLVQLTPLSWIIFGQAKGKKKTVANQTPEAPKN
ncbi:acyltransferase [Bacillus horti]|uniref:Peptidoglycan/LPS O-acetylase OafA/YrhL n=1 Tax=Caldalkalibacillus horti TaxID=77523 RepID=A0ABT9VZD5_9BACI|nr:acyltransferase [Bacillus horti]MDQ0166356.1 peptidoglycan/LPS O-acetylase OafA/YrhL [Bacillus horti]